MLTSIVATICETKLHHIRVAVQNEVEDAYELTRRVEDLVDMLLDELEERDRAIFELSQGEMF